MSRKGSHLLKLGETKLPRRADRRVRQTRNALGDALIELMREKPFAAIKVQHVLDRAGISRSTFYTHYRDKNDLLLSDADEFFEMMSTALVRRREASERVAPVREMLEHVAEMRTFLASLMASGKLQDTMDLAQGHFARGIEMRLAQLSRSCEIAGDTRALMGTALAGALLAILNRWLQQRKPAAAEQVDLEYHRMAWGGVSAPIPVRNPSPRR
jgi:AcrR family transcriptional regulator